MSPTRSQLRCTLPASVGAAAVARRFVGSCCDLGEAETATVVLLASELVANAVRHATGEPTLVVETLPDRVRVEVFDDAVPVGDLRADDPGTNSESGRGLFLVGALASRWGSGSGGGGGKVVWFELDLVAPVAGPSS